MQVAALRVTLRLAFAHTGGQGPALIDRLPDLNPHRSTARRSFGAEGFGQAIGPLQRHPWLQAGFIAAHQQISGSDLVLHGQDIGVLPHSQCFGCRDTIRHAWQAWRRAKTTGVRAHGHFVIGLGTDKIALRTRKIAACGCQLCLCKRDVGTRYFTHFKTIPRGAQFLRQNAHVVFPKRHKLLRLDHAHIGVDSAQQDLLFGTHQCFAGGQHGFFGCFDRIARRAKVIDKQRCHEVDRRGEGIGRVSETRWKSAGAGAPADRLVVRFRQVSRPLQHRLEHGFGDGHVFVGSTQHGAVLVQQTGVVIGPDQRISQCFRLRRHRSH